jgi:hypothetical protein
MRETGGVVMKLALAIGATALLTAACGASAPAGGASSGGVSSGGASSTYSGPSWTAYLDTQPGRTCTLANPQSASTGNVNTQLAQTVVSTAATASGEVLHYRIDVSASVPGGSIPPTRSSLNIPYEVLRDGQLGVTPDGDSLGSGLVFMFKGFELYPTVRELASGGSPQTSVVDGLLIGTTATARTEIRQMITSGSALQIEVDIVTSAAPAKASIITPSGTYRDAIGVKAALVKMTVVNGTAATKQAFSAASGFAKAFNSVLYFARGTGLVQATSGGFQELLTGCRG